MLTFGIMRGVLILFPTMELKNTHGYNGKIIQKVILKKHPYHLKSLRLGKKQIHSLKE